MLHHSKKNLCVAASAAMLLAVGMATTPAQAQTCEVKIGTIGPMSGGAAAFGLAETEAAKFAAATVNAEGGLQVGDKKCQVKVYPYDAKYTAAGGAAGGNYFASEGIHVTLGPIGSPETTGFRPVAARNDIVGFNSSYMHGAIDPEFPLMFHALQTPQSWGPILVKAAIDQFKFKSVFITAANDQGGTDGGHQLAGFYKAAGVTPTENYFQRGTTNFAPLAEQIMNSNADAIEISTAGPGDAKLIIKQLYEAGFDGIIGSLGGVGIGPIAEGAGGEQNLKNVFWLELVPADNPGIIKMKEDYKKLMGSAAPTNGLFPVFEIAAEVTLNAISKAGTDQDGKKIAEALRHSTPTSRYMGSHGWRGKTIYGINQELSFPIGLGMVVDGKKLPIKTVDIPAEE